MSGERFVSPVFSAFDVNGEPVPGAKLYFYNDGTNNPKDTYSDVALTNANPNPVEADGAGRFTPDIFLQNSAYRVKLTDADDVQIWQYDDVNNIVQNTTTGTLPFPGMVTLFYGTQAQLNTWLSNTWYVMDGNNGTPNLDETFIRGTINIAGIGLTGGSDNITPSGTVEDHTLTLSEIPAHTHSMGNSGMTTGGTNCHVNGAGSGVTNSAGGGGPHNHTLTMNQHTNMPVYYQLIFLYYGGT